MPSVLPVLSQYVRRIARREIRTETSRTRRASTQHRRDIAALKRLIKSLADRLAVVEKHGGHKSPTLSTASASADNLRFRVDGLRSHRSRLGLSARDYGKLIGVSGLTIYHWEAGKAKPRRKQLPAIAAVRKMGRREAMRVLEDGK